MSIPHLSKVLREKKTVVTRALFWRIPHHTPKQDVRLKIGRNKKSQGWTYNEQPENLAPKSELTLDNEEFRNLIEFDARRCSDVLDHRPGLNEGVIHD